MTQSTSSRAAVLIAHCIGEEVASKHADDVDKHARFPQQAIDALRQAKLLSALVPKELGGAGMTMPEISEVCAALGQYCASTAMVFAMHQIQVACIVRHGLSSQLFRDYCAELVERQMLLASATSEVGVGGDTRSSICAVEVADGAFSLNKDATTVSYGANADDLLVTSRRSADAARSDQVVVLARKGQYRLEQTTNWDTLGMRGTCSPGYRLTSSGPAAQIMPGSFADASSQTMVPYSHILWSSLWLGIATDAVTRAARFVRADARSKPGIVPPTALRLAEVSNDLHMMRATVHNMVREFADAQNSIEDADALLGMGVALKMNNLKVASSTLLVTIVHQALLVCGILGYKNDSPFSLCRHLRDAYSAPLMIGNDRILAKNASMLLVYKDV